MDITHKGLFNCQNYPGPEQIEINKRSSLRAFSNCDYIIQKTLSKGNKYTWAISERQVVRCNIKHLVVGGNQAVGIKLPVKKEKKENAGEDTRMKSKAWDPMRFQTMATKNILGNVSSIKG